MEPRPPKPKFVATPSSEFQAPPTRLANGEKADLVRGSFDDIHDWELPRNTLNNDNLEIVARQAAKNEDKILDQSDHLMESIFHDMDHATALAIQEMIISDYGATCIRRPAFLQRPLTFIPKLPIYEEEKEPYLRFHSFQMDKIYEVVDQTWNSSVEPVLKKISGLSFDYLELQTGIRVEFELQVVQFLWRKLFPNDGGGGPGLHDDAEQAKPFPKVKRQLEQYLGEELQRIYGPLDMDHASVPLYVKQYFKWMMGKRKALKKELKYLRGVIMTDGEDKVRSHLISRKLDLEDMKFLLREKLTEKGIIYDLNPFTNLAHMDWFLLPRRPQIGENGLFLDRPKLPTYLSQHLRPNRKAPSFSLTIPGYWPSLMDLGATKGVHTVEDIVHRTHLDTLSNLGKLSDKQINIRRDHTRTWKGASHVLLLLISRHPLGIETNKFFAKAKTCHQFFYRPEWFGPNNSLEEAVKDLDDVFVSRTFPIFQKGGKGVSQGFQTLLFPSYLRGVLPEDITTVMLRIWKRLIFLLESAPNRRLDVGKVNHLYWQHFNTRIDFSNWGFDNVGEFAWWCQEIWKPTQGRIGVREFFEFPGKSFLYFMM